MPETSPSTNDSSGVIRTPTGEIASPQPTSTPPSTPEPQPSPSTPPETKTAEKSDGKASGRSIINEKSEEPKGAPEKYEDFKVPEGYVLDAEVAKDASALFKRLDLNQSGAQELVDFYVAKTKEAHEAPFTAYMEMRQKWRDEVNKNSDLGGSKLDATRGSIAKLVNSLGKPELQEAFRDIMDFSGAGDHPAVVEALTIWARRLTEGGAVKGNGPSVEGFRDPAKPAPSPAQAIYPHLPSNRG